MMLLKRVRNEARSDVMLSDAAIVSIAIHGDAI
jgi:hypothetical protein